MESVQVYVLLFPANYLGDHGYGIWNIHSMELQYYGAFCDLSVSSDGGLSSVATDCTESGDDDVQLVEGIWWL